jgi:hypothetical protein
MFFSELWNLLLEDLMLESITDYDLLRFDAKINKAEESFRLKDKERFKKELKKIKKELISKMIKEDYKSLMSRYFPQLRDKKYLTDEEFNDMFFGNPENWEHFDRESFKTFINEVEKSIEIFIKRRLTSDDKLRLLSKEYVKY